MFETGQCYIYLTEENKNKNQAYEGGGGGPRRVDVIVNVNVKDLTDDRYGMRTDVNLTC